MSKKTKKLKCNNITGFTGVQKSREKFKAEIYIGRQRIHLGTHNTAKAAGLAYDRAVVKYKRPRSKMNYRDGLQSSDEVYEEYMSSTKKRKLRCTNTSGYTGVQKARQKFKARVSVDGKCKNLGTYDTIIEAALAFDRAVIEHRRPRSLLNFPNKWCSTSNDDASSDEESDGGGSCSSDSSGSSGSSGSSDSSVSGDSSDSCHSSDDDESDDEDAHKPQPKPHFYRDPMLDQLFADQQKLNSTKKNNAATSS